MSGTTPRHPTHAIVVALVIPGVVASAIRVLVPGGTTLLGERGEALLGLRARALASDHSRGVPLRRAVTQPSDLLDDRREDAEPGLRESELRARLRDHEVAYRAQAHAAPERGALDPGDDGDRARIDRLEHLRHGHRVLLIALDVQRHRRTHPADVRAGTEGLALARQDDGAELRRRILLERRER